MEKKQLCVLTFDSNKRDLEWMHLPKCERACMYVSVSISTSISAHAITYSKWVIHKQAPVAYRRASSSREVYSGYIFFFKKKKIEGNDGKKKKQNIPEV